MNCTLKTFFIIMILSCSATYGMQQELIKIKVGNEMYELTPEQAAQSETLQVMLKKQTNPEEPIILPSSITAPIFKFIYDDLQDIEFDSSILSDKMIGALYNAVYYLKIPWLIEKYAEITADRATDITLEVDNKPYILTVAQAKKSNTLLHSLEDVEDYSIPIPLSYISRDIFEYIYNDLTDVDNDFDFLTAKEMVDLINAANYLDAPKLLQKYQNLLIERLIEVDTEEELKKHIKLIQEELPQEMQEPLSQRICAKSAELFKELPESEIKHVTEREYNYEKIVFSSSLSKMIVQDDSSMRLVDLASNKTLWKKNFKAQDMLFSSDDSKVLISNGQNLQIFNTQDGVELLNKQFNELTLTLLGFFSDINRFAAQDSVTKKVILLDATTGDPLFEIKLPEEKSSIKKFYYDTDSQSICLTAVSAEFEGFVLVIDAKNGKIIKKKSDTKTEHYTVSPDGKKIIFLSKELVSVENSFNEEVNFSWALKEQSNNIPFVNSFSENGRLFSVVSYKSLVTSYKADIFVLDMVTGETLYTQSNVEVESATFSPDARQLLLQTKYSITTVNLYSKKLLTRGFSEHILGTNYISESTIVLYTRAWDLARKILFYEGYTGQIITKINKVDEHANPLVLIRGALKNNLFVSLIYLNINKIACFDISPLHIFIFLNQPYVPINQALLIYYSLKMIQNDSPIIIPRSLETIYDDLPQEIKSLLDNHNRQLLPEVNIRVGGTAALKKLPKSRFRKFSKD